MRKFTTNEPREASTPAANRARRLLLKAGLYAAPAILATAITAQNVYAGSKQGS